MFVSKGLDALFKDSLEDVSTYSEQTADLLTLLIQLFLICVSSVYFWLDFCVDVVCVTALHQLQLFLSKSDIVICHDYLPLHVLLLFLVLRLYLDSVLFELDYLPVQLKDNLAYAFTDVLVFLSRYIFLGFLLGLMRLVQCATYICGHTNK